MNLNRRGFLKGLLALPALLAFKQAEPAASVDFPPMPRPEDMVQEFSQTIIIRNGLPPFGIRPLNSGERPHSPDDVYRRA